MNSFKCGLDCTKHFSFHSSEDEILMYIVKWMSYKFYMLMCFTSIIKMAWIRVSLTWHEGWTASSSAQSVIKLECSHLLRSASF